jgi:hypothetical protein
VYRAVVRHSCIPTGMGAGAAGRWSGAGISGPVLKNEEHHDQQAILLAHKEWHRDKYVWLGAVPGGPHAGAL